MFAELVFVSLSDCHLWEELLCLSQKCVHAAHEKHNKVCADVCCVCARCMSDLSYVNVLERVGSVLLCVPSRVVVLDKVTDLLLFFGKLLVVGGVGEADARKMGSS